MTKTNRLALSAIVLSVLAAASTLSLSFIAQTEQQYGYAYIVTGFIAPTVGLFLAVLSIRSRRKSGEHANLPVFAVAASGLVFGFFTLWVIAGMFIQGLAQAPVAA